MCNVTPVYLGEKASEYVRRTGCTLHKIIIMSTPEEAARKIEIIRAACPELDVSQSTPEYIEAVDKRSGKGNAVLAMAARFGLTPADVAAFGDQTNDLSMLRAAAFAACPENAVQAVKDASDVVAKDVEEGGMADVIEWILE